VTVAIERAASGAPPGPYPWGVFGRKDSQKPQVAQEPAAEAAPTTGKGRPTPKRREAEQANRRPVVSGGRAPAAQPNATKEERKAARETRRVAMQADRAKMRQAMLTGDERYYPERDKGPARKWAREYVDARRNIGEYFLFFAIAFLLLSQLRNSALNLALAVLLYAGFLAMAVDAYLIRRKVVQETTKRFGADKAAGVGMYAISRSLQIRRMRLPRPQIARGQYPE
jgi:hypothetical protein